MKILVIQETDWELRGPHQQHHLFERLSELGHEIVVIDYEFLWSQYKTKGEGIFSKTQVHSAKPKIIPNSKIKVITPAMIKLPILCYMSIPISHFICIYKQIKEFQPDIIVGFGILNCYIAQKLAKIFKIPFTYYLIDHLHRLLPIKSLQFVAKFIESKNIRNADKIFAINTGLLDYAISLGGSKDKGVYIPGGVDLSKYKNVNSVKEYKKRLGIQENDIVLLFMGWLYEFSGLRELTDYLVENEQSLPNFKLLIVGDGDLLQYIEKQKRRLKDPNKIILTYRVPYHEIPNYLQCAKYCLLPAYKNKIMENIVPIKLYEYLAAGKPIICTRLKGVIKEFGYNSGLIYIDHPEEVFNKVLETLPDYQKYVKQGEKTIFRYDWKNIVNRFIKEIESIEMQRKK